MIFFVYCCFSEKFIQGLKNSFFSNLVHSMRQKLFYFQDLTSSESGSETGLNCQGGTPGDEEVMPGPARPANVSIQQHHDPLMMEQDDVDLTEVRDKDKDCHPPFDGPDSASFIKHPSRERKP